MPYSSFLAGFEGMWRRPLSDYEKGVKEYLVTLDTNVLLNLYRFTPQARNELLSVLRTLQDRLWVSHQVAKEYYSRRMTAVSEHINLYTSVPKALADSRNKAIQELNTFAKRRSMSPEERSKLVDPLSEAFEAVIAEIKSHGQDFDLSQAKVATNDPILEALAEILDQKTGVEFEEQEAKDLLEKYARRASEEVPPGYKDASKAENAHGDFFLWEQVLREAADRKRPVLLVTNDAKEDWVQLEAGITIGPRPELMKEFKDRCGLDFLLTDLGTFLKVAKSELGAAVSESTVAQAENIEQAAPGSTQDQIMIPSEDFDEVVNDVIHSRVHFTRVLSDPKVATSVTTAAQSARDYLDDVLVEVKAPASRTADNRFVYIDPGVWEKLQRAQRMIRSPRSRRIQRSGSNSALVQQSRNLQERLQRMHRERDQAMDELQEVEELISLERGDDGENLERLMESHERLSEKLGELQRLERELSERLHRIQLELRSSNI
ncbi:PIN domain-containing protein [Streptomyces sp. NPDC090301]|uniref:PIN-like domain-containing protein n=1 Tax=Streptomyces sp. NPDC090301 TaxID=3154975 RepID=UPI003421A508